MYCDVRVMINRKLLHGCLLRSEEGLSGTILSVRVHIVHSVISPLLLVVAPQEPVNLGVYKQVVAQAAHSLGWYTVWLMAAWTRQDPVHHITAANVVFKARLAENMATQKSFRQLSEAWYLTYSTCQIFICDLWKIS